MASSRSQTLLPLQTRSSWHNLETVRNELHEIAHGLPEGMEFFDAENQCPVEREAAIGFQCGEHARAHVRSLTFKSDANQQIILY